MKKCKCSSEIQTRAANLHIPSSDKNLRVNIKDRWDRVKIKQDTRPNAQKWNVGPERRKGLGTSRADVSGNARHFCEVEFNFEDVSPNSTTRQKDRRQEKPHSVRFFCFHWISNHSHCEWFPQSLLDFLESRAMKRKSINHCISPWMHHENYHIW